MRLMAAFSALDDLCGLGVTRQRLMAQEPQEIPPASLRTKRQQPGRSVTRDEGKRMGHRGRGMNEADPRHGLGTQP